MEGHNVCTHVLSCNENGMLWYMTDLQKIHTVLALYNLPITRKYRVGSWGKGAKSIPYGIYQGVLRWFIHPMKWITMILSPPFSEYSVCFQVYKSPFCGDCSISCFLWSEVNYFIVLSVPTKKPHDSYQKLDVYFFRYSTHFWGRKGLPATDSVTSQRRETSHSLWWAHAVSEKSREPSSGVCQIMYCIMQPYQLLSANSDCIMQPYQLLSASNSCIMQQ